MMAARALIIAMVLAAITGNARAQDGAALYTTHCSSCHQAAGAGMPGTYPRLAGRIGPIARSPEGRRFVASVLLFGMSGSITADGKKITGYMPSFAWLPDTAIASILGYVSALPPGGSKPWKPAELAAVRAVKLSPSAVNTLAIDVPR